MTTYRVTRGREITFNPAPYESVKVFATITQEWDSENRVTPEPEALAEEMEGELDIFLKGEIDAVADVTTNAKSIVHDYRFTEER